MERPPLTSRSNSTSSKSSVGSISNTIFNASSVTTTTMTTDKNKNTSLSMLSNSSSPKLPSGWNGYSADSNNSSNLSLSNGEVSSQQRTISQNSSNTNTYQSISSSKNDSTTLKKSALNGTSATNTLKSTRSASSSVNTKTSEFFKSQPSCKRCNLHITKGQAYELGGEKWHVDCFSCYKCEISLDCDSDFLVLSTGSLICSDCLDRCKVCNDKIDELAIILSNSNESYCPKCFKCYKCGERITNLKYARTKKGLFCIECHEKLLERRRLNLGKRVGSHNSLTSHRSNKELPILPASLKKDVDSVGSGSHSTNSKIITADNTNVTPQFVLPKSTSSLGLALSNAFETDPDEPFSSLPPPRSPSRLFDNYSKRKSFNIAPLSASALQTSSFENGRNSLSCSFSSQTLSVNKKLADPIEFSKHGSSTEVGSDIKDEDSESLSQKNNLAQSIPNEPLMQPPKQPPPPSFVRPGATSAKPHAQAPSWTSPTTSGYNSVPSVHNSNNLRLQQQPSRASMVSNETLQYRSHSRNNSLNKDSASYSHSRKVSIDDILESTLENNAEDEQIMQSEKSPFRNVAIPKSPNRSIKVYGETEVGSSVPFTTMDPQVRQASYSSVVQDTYLTAQNTGDHQRDTTKSPAYSFSTPGTSYFPTFDEEPEQADTIHTDFGLLTDDNKTSVKDLLAAPTEQNETEPSVPNTPKRNITRSLSLKSPKRLFMSLTGTNSDTPKERQNSVSNSGTPKGRQNSVSNSGTPRGRQNSISSTGDTHSGWGVRTSNFSISRTPPVPSVSSNRLRTHKKSISASTGSMKIVNTPESLVTKSRMYSANASTPLSEQTLMDSHDAAAKLQQQLKQHNSGKSKSNGGHQRSVSASSAVSTQHRRLLSGESVGSMASQTSTGIPRLPDLKGFSKEFDAQNGNIAAKNDNSVEKSEDEGVKTTTSQLEKLQLEVDELKNTKETLENEIEALKKQKDDLSSAVDELCNSKSQMSSELGSISNASGTSVPEKKKMHTSISTTSSAQESFENYQSTNYLNDNSSVHSRDVSKPRFWKTIFSNKTSLGPISGPELISRSQKIEVENAVPTTNRESSNFSLEDFEKQVNSGRQVGNGSERTEMSLIQRCDFEQNSIPSLIRYCIEFIEGNVEYMKTEGLYRKSASKLVVESLESDLSSKALRLQLLSYQDYKSKIDNIISKKEEYEDCHVIASILKRYLRRLPIPVIPYSMYEQFISLFKNNNSNTGDNSMDKYKHHYILTQFSKNIKLMPKAHVFTLKCIIKHINHVSQYSSDNLMNLHNLCLVFAPGIIRDFDGSFEVSDIKEKNEVIEFITSNEGKLLVNNP